MYYFKYNVKTNEEVIMAEHVLHKKENKKAPQKNLKEKREAKKAKKKSKDG